MPRALRACPCPGCPTHPAAPCPNPVPPGSPTRTSRCPTCTREADRARGTARTRGYDRVHEQRFREAVLAAEPYCRLCYAPSVVADHWPLSRRELIAHGLDPNDPKRGRALCKRCHDIETATHQPGGWHHPGGYPPAHPTADRG